MALPTFERARPNLGAGPLGSYAFRVEATLGHRPMTYLFARSTEGSEAGSRTVTGLLVLGPDALAGTRVTVEETAGADRAEVTVYLPTMRAPKVVSAAHVFECLPLTDVGYVDLMAWSHPPSGPVPDDGSGAQTWRSEVRYGYEVVETVSREYGIPVARSTRLDGEEIRRWEVAEVGDPQWHHLPVRIRVTRTRTGHWTVFERTTQPRPVPPGLVTADTAELRDVATGMFGVFGR